LKTIEVTAGESGSIAGKGRRTSTSSNDMAKCPQRSLDRSLRAAAFNNLAFRVILSILGSVSQDIWSRYDSGRDGPMSERDVAKIIGANVAAVERLQSPRSASRASQFRKICADYGRHASRKHRRTVSRTQHQSVIRLHCLEIGSGLSNPPSKHSRPSTLHEARCSRGHGAACYKQSQKRRIAGLSVGAETVIRSAHRRSNEELRARGQNLSTRNGHSAGDDRGRKGRRYYNP